MRIGIDARFLTHPQRGGFKTYVQGVVEGLAAAAAGHDFILYVDRPGYVAPAGTTVRIVSGRAPLVGMPWREQVALPAAIRRDRLDLFHAPCNTAPLGCPAPLVLTIHDTIWLRPRPWSAGLQPATMDRYHRSVALRSARRASAVLTVSAASRDAICADLPFLDPERVVVAHNAPRPCFAPVAGPALTTALDAFNLHPGFVLALASADPRKNLPAWLQAYAALPRELRAGHPLVTVWAHPALASLARGQCDALGILGDVRFLSAVSDEALAALYSAAALFVFPSLAEGFGLPVLEAMVCGAPVLAGLDPAVRETAGDAAVLVDVRDVAALSAAAARVLDDAPLRDVLRKRGHERAASFSWARSARKTLAAYDLAIGSARGEQRRAGA